MEKQRFDKNCPEKINLLHGGIFALFMVLEMLICCLIMIRGLEIVELFHDLQF